MCKDNSEQYYLELHWSSLDLQWEEQRRKIWAETIAKMIWAAPPVKASDCCIANNESGGERSAQQSAAGDAENDNLAR